MEAQSLPYDVLKSVFECMSDGVAAFDEHGRILYCNPALAVLTGRPLEQLLGRTPMDAWGGRAASSYDTRLWFRAVASLTIDNELQPVIRGFLFDVTDLREAEERSRTMENRILQSQKLESLGLLASGIAHDFNNLLMAILGNASLALLEMDESQKPHRFVKQVEVAATRASELTRELLNYSGKGRFVFKAVNLSSLVREMGELLESVISKRATVRYEIADTLPPIDADASQIRQVVMNLITNASDALGQAEGSIVIRTGTTRVTDAFNPHALLAENLRVGEYVFFEVEDSGLGMDETTRQRIFDPFFTTKAKGRGLGLSAVLGIIRSHKGVVILESRPGAGTRFQILLPPSGKVLEDFVAESRDGTAKVSGVVLVIDDEKSVVQVARDTLERIGLRVLTAEGGRQGLDLYIQHRKEIDVVLLDVVMPHISGEEVCRELRSRDASLPILLSSGYNASEDSSALQLGPTVDFIQKPYRPSDLQSKIRHLLGRARRPQATAP